MHWRSGTIVAETAMMKELFPHLLKFLSLIGSEGGAHVQAKIDCRFFLGQSHRADLVQFAVDCVPIRIVSGEQVF